MTTIFGVSPDGGGEVNHTAPMGIGRIAGLLSIIPRYSAGEVVVAVVDGGSIITKRSFSLPGLRVLAVRNSTAVV